MCAIPIVFQPDINKAVDILRSAGCDECYIFGSLSDGRADNESDIDLAVRGLPPEMFFYVYGQLSMQISRSIDLVDLDDGSRFSQKLQRREAMTRVF
jgi:predicted nucleotidyltransferase